jgi:hypothetical protein
MDTNPINCNENQFGNCEEDYDHGTMVTLTATAPAGSRFVSWSGGGCPVTVPPATPLATCVVTMTGPVTVTANFTLVDTLSVTKTGAGTGTVTSNPAGISCGGSCSASFDENSLVLLTATPTAGSRFVAWTGCVTQVGDPPNTCVATMSGDQAVTAQFQPNTLTVMLAGTGTGSVASTTPTGITCGADCTENITVGQTVHLVATPSGASTFAGWSANCVPVPLVPTECDVLMDTAKTVTATFDP